MKHLWILLLIIVLQACSTSNNMNDESPKEETPTVETPSDPSTDDQASNESDEETTEDDGMKRLTLKELAFYDGKDDRPAYIAVDGNIYDVSNDPYWRNGIHQGQFQAGQDLSEEILSSPHGKRYLTRVPLIGYLIEDES
jgi:predicted heme/steroid binding protein